MLQVNPSIYKRINLKCWTYSASSNFKFVILYRGKTTEKMILLKVEVNGQFENILVCENLPKGIRNVAQIICKLVLRRVQSSEHIKPHTILPKMLQIRFTHLDPGFTSDHYCAAACGIGNALLSTGSSVWARRQWPTRHLEVHFMP